MATESYSLPKLPYSLNALEPVISAQIMDLHYNKHHNTYVTSLNNALKSHADALTSNNLVKQIELQPLIKFHAGGHINHTLFWENLQPPSSSSSSSSTQTAQSAAPKLTAAIASKYSSLESFISTFTTTALALQGSGWVWLVKSSTSTTTELSIVTTKDQDLVPAGFVPLFGVDMWEHAYYLQHLNNKKAYVDGIWSVINWGVAEKRFVAADLGVVYGKLVGLAAGKI